MEGVLYQKKGGVLKGYKKYFAILDDCSQNFILRKKSYDGKENMRFQCKNLLIFPILVSSTDFLIVHNQSTYKFRAESPFKRYQWLLSINAITQNLTEDLQVIKFPMIKGREYKKDIDPL